MFIDISQDGLKNLEELEVDEIKLGKHSFKTLVAVSEVEQARGLMYCEWPPPVMTFPYKQASYLKFWMKNTVSPLDIIFCRAGKIIDICYGEPMSTRMVGPNEPSDMVVELPHGTAEACGLQIGDAVKFRRSQETYKKLFPTAFLD